MAVLITAGVCFLDVWPAESVLQWFLIACLILSYIHFQLFSNLGRNHPPATGELRPSLGVANGITLTRGLGVSCIAGFILLPGNMLSGGSIVLQWMPGLLYLSIGCADFLDGLWARHTRTESDLGRHLDLEIDALGILAASMLGVRMGRLPLFYLLVGASYYLFKFGIRYRHQRGKSVLPLKHRVMARIAAGLNMGFVGAALLPVFSETVLRLAAYFFAIPLLAGFVWDWLVVSARLTDGNAERFERILVPAAGFAPLLSRFILLACPPVAAGTLLTPFPAKFALFGIGLWAMMVLGWLGRSAALIAVIWLSHAASRTSAPPVFLVALSASLVLLILGTGYGSWWKPEDALLSRKAGRFRFPPPHAGFAMPLLIPLLYWVALGNIPLRELLSVLTRLEVFSVTGLIVLNLLILQAMCLRWRLILTYLGHEIPFLLLITYRIAANAVNYMTPGPQIGGEPLQVHWLIRRHGVPADEAAASVGVDRLMELICNFGVLLPMGFLSLQAHYFPTRPPYFILTSLALFLVAAALLCGAIAKSHMPLTRIARFSGKLLRIERKVARPVNFLERSEKQAAAILSAPGPVLLRYGGCAGIQWLLILIEFWYTYHVLGVSLNLLQLLTLVSAARLAFLLPLPGALGALEAGQCVVLAALALNPVSGLAACLIIRARDLILIGIGAISCLRRIPGGTAQETLAGRHETTSKHNHEAD
jgi:CDP-diacylglycerol--glycerol-3-phosphate 3-phosphatidyltransferase